MAFIDLRPGPSIHDPLEAFPGAKLSPGCSVYFLGRFENLGQRFETDTPDPHLAVMRRLAGAWVDTPVAARPCDLEPVALPEDSHELRLQFDDFLSKKAGELFVKVV